MSVRMSRASWESPEALLEPVGGERGREREREGERQRETERETERQDRERGKGAEGS